MTKTWKHCSFFHHAACAIRFESSNYENKLNIVWRMVWWYSCDSSLLWMGKMNKNELFTSACISCNLWYRCKFQVKRKFYHENAFSWMKRARIKMHWCIHFEQDIFRQTPSQIGCMYAHVFMQKLNWQTSVRQKEKKKKEDEIA